MARRSKTSRGSLPAPTGRRRGIALLLVMLVVASLMAIGILFTASVSAAHRSATYHRLATQSEQYCIAGLHRAMAELMYDVWGVDEDRPFESARYNPVPLDPPHDNLLPLRAAAYYESSSGGIRPIVRQNGFWNGEAWVVWAGDLPAGFPSTGDAGVDANVWNMDPRPATRPEKPGGAQRYVSAGQGTVSVTRGEKIVIGRGTHFDPSWSPGTDIAINGVRCDIRSVTSPTSLSLWSPWTGPTAAGLGWYVHGAGSPAGSADGSLPGGPMSLASFVAGGKGYAANPRWINPEAFISRSTMHGEAFSLYGGVDLNGDGVVDVTDKRLRDWALWKLRCDAFLPEGMDNTDAFELQMHANDRLRGDRSAFLVGHSLETGAKDVGYEFLSPFIVGDSFYQIFRFEPIHTMCPRISGGPPGAAGLAERSDRPGYRYPYDRGHPGKDPAVAPADDPAGGLVNINPVDNNYGVEQWTDTPGAGEGPEALGWRHVNEAKWIYCYDPVDARRRLGRYSVTVMPDGGSWNVAALQSGTPDPNSSPVKTAVTAPCGGVRTAGALLAAIRDGFHAKTGEPSDARLLASVSTALGTADALCCYAPIRPEPLPPNWTPFLDAAPPSTPVTYWCPDGAPGSSGGLDLPGTADRTRAPEVWGTHGGGAWDASTGVRSAVFNYLVWLGPYDSRAELATHLRKACLCIPEPPPSGAAGAGPSARSCMETGVNVSASARERVARSARLVAAQTSVHGYHYALDRFWDRSLLLVDWSPQAACGGASARISTAQCAPDAPIDCFEAGWQPGQRTRTALLRELNGLECFGGYRTRDGSYRLLDYLFHDDASAHGYEPFLADRGRDCYAPSDYRPGPDYGGPGPVQARAGRREKFLATAVSRMASAQRPDGQTAACANGHLLHNPAISVFHRPEWDVFSGRREKALRRSAADPCLDEIAAGCPVCGGRLFLANVYEMNVNEIGAFRGKLRTAERPTRAAWDLADPSGKRRPMRHFVELMLSGRYRENGATNAVARFDMLLPGSGADAGPVNTPAILADPVTGRPYFTSHLECERRWRASTDAASPVYGGGLDPEPIFRGLPNKPGDGGGPYSNYLNLHLLVYDDNDHGGRWHDVTWCVDHPASAVNHRTGKPDFYGGDPGLYDRDFLVDDSDPDPARWTAERLRCDERYAMADPDPAHRQQSPAASVSIYRKMPVRWYGGDRRDAWELHYKVMSHQANAPLGRPGTGLPAETDLLRGIGFPETIRLSNKRDFYAHHDCLYVGDAAWLATSAAACSPVGFAFSPNTEWPAFRLTDPGQYGVISFDASFDGSRVALVYGQAADEIPDYRSPCRIVSYVELTDSSGTSLRISDACRGEVGGVPAQSDPSRSRAAGAPTVYSWQARNPRDTRGNADGYTLWDLLPMTLNGDVIAGANDPLDEAVGYDPWWIADYGPGCNWWGSGDDGFADRLSPQRLPAGYRDLAGRMACGNRNGNTWNANVPVRRPAFDGTTATSRDSREAVHEALIRTMHDHCNVAGPQRACRDKSNAMSTPTGIGRQAGGGGERAPSPAPPTGRQSLVAVNFQGRRCVWREGAATEDPRRTWADFSWSSWYKLFEVTDLCERLLWSSDPNEPGGSFEVTDMVDSDRDGLLDETSTASLAYVWSRDGAAEAVPAAGGHYAGELRQVNKVNLNELSYPPNFSAAGWNQSYASFGRKPLKGFHSPSDSLVRHYACSSSDPPYDLYTTDPGYNLRITPWDLDSDASLDGASFNSNGAYYGRLSSSHCGSSPVYTLFVTGDALDEQGEPLAESRLRAVVERTWDGRCNVLEFNWVTKDRGLGD